MEHHGRFWLLTDAPSHQNQKPTAFMHFDQKLSPQSRYVPIWGNYLDVPKVQSILVSVRKWGLWATDIRLVTRVLGENAGSYPNESYSERSPEISICKKPSRLFPSTRKFRNTYLNQSPKRLRSKRAYTNKILKFLLKIIFISSTFQFSFSPVL